MSTDFTPIKETSGPGEARRNLDELARLFPDAVADGRVDLDVLRDLLGQDAEPAGTEPFGLRWPGMSETRRLATLPATGTLLPKPEESVDWDTTRNIVIEGDNLEVLRNLRRGYTNKVDVIYIDPPYNTGNDFVYDDSRMSSLAEYEADAGLRDEDGVTERGGESSRAEDRRSGASRHAKWLSMMYPRLITAHSLLKETGVIIVAIDDTEHARLKLLMDRVLGAENFIANITWQGGRKNDSRFVSVSHDYMLIYAKDQGLLRSRDIRWRERKPGVDEALQAAKEIWSKHQGDPTKAQKEWREWMRSFKASGIPTDAVTRFTTLDQDGRPIRTDGSTISPNPRPNLRYPLTHPITGAEISPPANGWRYSREEMQRRIDAGLINFGTDESKVPSAKTFLDQMDSHVAESVFERDRNAAGLALRDLLGSDVFNFPKDSSVIADWIGLASANNPNALVLDFFAGSGSTGHAVMDLNAADGGRRRFILVQLDEPVNRDGYATIADITRERLRRAGRKVAENLTLESTDIDLGFRSYRLASSNLLPWDGKKAAEDIVTTLLESTENLVEGRTTDDLLVEMMLRLGIDLTTPLEKRQVAGSTLYSLGGGTLYAYFGTEITTDLSNEVAKAIVAWRDKNIVDSDVTVVVRDSGFQDSSAKLNLAAALDQAGVTTLRSI
ncbi:site-specific DNA-methyltransferase [Promicromonospora sp. NPDC059942]|uniref:site-specific DNA-methyltransferase n=1 Tax=Promicromonospora sp. NPDC059942 TaxID=3347009 RepID=UPI003647132A